MIVNEIVKLILELQGMRLSDLDKDLLARLQNKFLGSDTQKNISESDVKFILNIYQMRWKADSESDYLLDPSGVNEVWIKFGRKLALCLNKSDLEVLLPTIPNKLDFNNSSPLNETKNLDNFFLGSNGVLYRKRSFCEYLMSTSNRYLTITRNRETKEKTALTITELSRLKGCKQVIGEFTITSINETFVNFWDFLEKKIFPTLQSKGKQPFDLLAKLLFLIEEYNSLKASKADFNKFVRSLNEFFVILNRHGLEQINYFYGNRITFNGKSCYLLDLLIVLNTAQSYTIDDALNSILTWLHSYNPILQMASLPIASRNLLPAAAAVASHREHNIIQCKNLILSLFTLNFNVHSCRINLWDKENDLFQEAADLYREIQPALSTGAYDQLLVSYNQVMSKWILNHNSSTNFLTKMFFENKLVETWYKHAKNGTLHEMQVNWFEPECLMHVLLRIDSVHPEATRKIKVFIDEIIHTYHDPDKSKLLKEFRVNIVFSELLKELHKISVHDVRHVMILMALCPKDEARDSFLTNCNTHIIACLSQIDAQPHSSPQFYQASKKVDRSRLIIPNLASGTIVDLVRNYKIKIEDLKLEPGLLQSMSSYLTGLSDPIITVEQKVNIESENSELDSINQRN